jgi:hypothetical protein
MRASFVPFSVRCPQHKGAASERIRVDWIVKQLKDARKVDSLDEITAEDDIVVLQKVYGAGINPNIAKMKRDGKKIVLDICDPDWQSPNLLPYVIEIVLLSDAITVPSPGMQDLIVENFGIDPKKIWVIEDMMDLDYHNSFKIHSEIPTGEIPRLVWFGNSGTIGALAHYIPDLEELYDRIKFELVLISNQGTILPATKIPLDYYLWNLETVNMIIMECDVAINPKIVGEEYKSNNKTLTAWACGLPCIEVWPWSEPIWKLRLQSYLESQAQRKLEGQDARKHIERWYNTKQSAKEWEKLFDKLREKNGA